MVYTLFYDQQNLIIIIYRKKCRELQAMKNKRMAEYASLKAVEEELCDQLYITPYYVEKGIVPSQKQLKDIKVIKCMIFSVNVKS